MRRVVAYVKPFKLEPVLGVLNALGIEDVSVEDVLGYARQKGHKELYAGSEYDITYIPKVRVDAMVPDEHVEQVLLRVAEVARTGRIGDGKILVGAPGDIRETD